MKIAESKDVKLRHSLATGVPQFNVVRRQYK